MNCQRYWIERFGAQPPTNDATRSQRAWDLAAIETAKSAIEAGVTEARDKARLLSRYAAPHSGDWLKALPISCMRSKNVGRGGP